MKNKVIPRHSWDISMYRSKTQQELKPLKAEASAAPAFCSCCFSTHLLCVHTLTEIASVHHKAAPVQTSTCCTVAEIFFCFPTKFNLLPISDTPYLDGLHSYTPSWQKLLLSWFSSTVYGGMSMQSAILWGKFVVFLSLVVGGNTLHRNHLLK